MRVVLASDRNGLDYKNRLIEHLQKEGYDTVDVGTYDNVPCDTPVYAAKAANELEHCILAHHGELEYGSPKKPALIEALALSMADNTDAKIQTFIQELDAAKDNNGWLGFNRALQSNIRKTSDN